MENEIADWISQPPGYISPPSTETYITDSFVLSECTMTIKSGRVIDLQAVIQEIVFFEDMFSPNITGSILIQDMAGGHEKFILTGGEKLTIRVMRGDRGETIITRADLVVYEISKMKVDNQNSLTYELRFTTETAIKSHKKRVFKSFGTDRKISSIVKKLYKEINDDYRIFIQDFSTAAERPFICPGYNPIEAIQFIAKRACSDGNYYVFFERVNTNIVTGNNFSHYFANVKYIKDYFVSRGVPRLTVQPAIRYTTNPGQTEIQIRSYQIQQNFNHMTAMTQGYYNSNVKTLDLLTRGVTNSTINYKQRNANQLGDVYRNAYLDAYNIFNVYDQGDVPGERLIVAPQSDIISNKSEWIKQDVYGAITNSAIRLIIEIPGGNNKIGVGDVVEVNIPSIANKLVNQQNSLVPNDAVYSGNYMVTAVKHMITKTAYVKRLEVSRGTFRFDIDQIIALGQ